MPIALPEANPVRLMLLAVETLPVTCILPRLVTVMSPPFGWLMVVMVRGTAFARPMLPHIVLLASRLLTALAPIKEVPPSEGVDDLLDGAVEREQRLQLVAADSIRVGDARVCQRP